MSYRLPRLRISLAAIFSCAFASYSQADEPSHFSGPNWTLLDTKAVLAEAASIDPAHFPNCDSVTVDRKIMEVIHEDGTAETQNEEFVKVLTEKGRRSNSTRTRGFRLPYMTQPVVSLEIIRPDGTVAPVDVAANGTVSIDSSLMRMNIYDPDIKVYRINIPKVEIGDIVHFVLRESFVRPVIPGEFGRDMLLQAMGYVRHTSIEFRVPATKPFKQIALRHEVPGTVIASKNTDGPDLVYHWEVNKVPQIFPEPAMPPPDEVAQCLSVSTMADWNVVSKWYWDLSQPHLEAITPEMKKKVAELTAGATTDSQRIKAIFYYVSKNIRYMGLTFENDRPGFAPHDVCVTFDKKYGVCRDKAALLVAMLRAAGQNAYPVLVSVGTKLDPQIPSTFFNHAIVGVELAKGQYQLMDPTAENTRQLLPGYDDNQTYLVCRPEGETLRLSPVDPPAKNMMQIATTGTLSSQGTLEARSEMTFNGINDQLYRQALAQMEEDQQRRFMEATLKRIMPGAVLKGLTITPDDLTDSSEPLHIALVYSVANTTVFGEGKAIVNMPWIGKNVGIVNFLLLRQMGLEKRKYPMRTFFACGLHEDISLRLDGGYTRALSMPTCAPQDDDCLAYQRTYSFNDGTLSCSRDLTLKTVEFSPDQYLRLKEILKTMDQDDRKAPLMAATEQSAPAAAETGPEAAKPVRADVSILEDHMEVKIDDAHNATFKVHTVRKVLTYNGRKLESEFKYPYNPSTEEVHLIRAVVTSKEGKAQEVSPQEINVMDADWNSVARRYTGGKVLVANFPGVEVGSTIDLEYECSSHGKPFIAQSLSLELRNEVTQLERRVTAPAGLTVQMLDHGATGVVVATHESGDGKQVWDWKASDVKATPEEGRLPPPWYWRSQASFFVGSFPSYLTDLNQALLARSANSAKATKLALELAHSAPTGLGAVQAIRDYVARSIRPAGPAFTDLPLTQLSDADTTLADGYGDLADQAILLHAMLAAAGFKPEFVLASDVPAIEPLRNIVSQFPVPDEFQSMLVKIDVDGQSYYLNDTDQYARLGSTVHEGKLGLLLSDQSYQTIKAVPGDETRILNHDHVTVSENGSVRLTIEHEYFGTAFGAQNKTFSEMLPETRKRYYENVVSHLAQGARPVGDLTTNFATYPGIERFTVDIDHYAVVDGKYLYFDLPYTPRLIQTPFDRHALPLMIGSPSININETVVDLPPSFKDMVIAPRNQDLRAPDGAGGARISAGISGTTWTLTDTLDAEPAIIAPGHYQALLQLESVLENRASHFLLLQRESNSPVPKT